MSSNDIGSTEVKPPTSPRRRRWTWITIATVGIISASALLAVPAIAANGGSDHSNDRLIVCESGVETNGDVQISSANVTRLPEGDNSPVPAGCREG